MQKNYTIAVAGTGYVGLSIATLLSQHHKVMAVDIVKEKVDLINNKKSPIQDDYIEKYLAEKDLNLTAKGITNCIDSCTMMQENGFSLHLVDGPGENIKITTPEDFYTMRAILEAKENAQIYGFDE